MVYHNTIKNSAYTMSFTVFEEKEWVSQYKKIWNDVESQLFENLATEPIKGEGRYVHSKLKTWKQCIKTNFDGQFSYDMYCFATAVLKIDSVYKQGKNYHLQVYVEEYKYTDAENLQCSMLIDDDDDYGFLKCEKKAKNILLIINEQDVAVRTCKKNEYTTSKLYENKTRA